MYLNVKCRIKKVVPTVIKDGGAKGGFGFLVSVEKNDPIIMRDIFFHHNNVIQVAEGEIDWSDLREGMTVTAGVVSVEPKGYEAFEISLPPRANKKNHNF